MVYFYSGVDSKPYTQDEHGFAALLTHLKLARLDDERAEVTVTMAHTATLTMPWYLQHVKRTIDAGQYASRFLQGFARLADYRTIPPPLRSVDRRADSGPIGALTC